MDLEWLVVLVIAFIVAVLLALYWRDRVPEEPEPAREYIEYIFFPRCNYRGLDVRPEWFFDPLLELIEPVPEPYCPRCGKPRWIKVEASLFEGLYINVSTEGSWSIQGKRLQVEIFRDAGQKQRIAVLADLKMQGDSATRIYGAPNPQACTCLDIAYRSRLPKLLMVGRRGGKTIAAVDFAKANDATVICHTEREAERLRRSFGVRAVGPGPDRLWGYQGNIVIENLFMHRDFMETLRQARICTAAGHHVICTTDVELDVVTLEDVYKMSGGDNECA